MYLYSYANIDIHMHADIHACMADIPTHFTAIMADTPPPITVWNLGLLSSQKRGEIETAFMGSSCLKYLRI